MYTNIYKTASFHDPILKFRNSGGDLAVDLRMSQAVDWVSNHLLLSKLNKVLSKHTWQNLKSEYEKIKHIAHRDNKYAKQFRKKLKCKTFMWIKMEK